MKNLEIKKTLKSSTLLSSLIIAISIIISGYMVSSAIKAGFAGTMDINGDVEIRRGDVTISTSRYDPIEVSGDFYSD